MWTNRSGAGGSRVGMIPHSGTIALLVLLTGGGSLQGRQVPHPLGVGVTGPGSATPRQECVSWAEHRARFEAAGGRRNSSPSTFHTGVLIRATGNLVTDANGVDLAATIRQATIQVGTVLCGSPAAASGLREGDEILTVNEKNANAPGVLPSLQYPKKAGELFRVRVRRGEDVLTFTVTSVRRPKEAGGTDE